MSSVRLFLVTCKKEKQKLAYPFQHLSINIPGHYYNNVCVQIHRKDVELAWGQVSVEASQVLPRQTEKMASYWLGFGHGGIVMLKQERELTTVRNILVCCSLKISLKWFKCAQTELNQMLHVVLLCTKTMERSEWARTDRTCSKWHKEGDDMCTS